MGIFDKIMKKSTKGNEVTDKKLSGKYYATKEEQEHIGNLKNSRDLKNLKKKLAIAGVTFSCAAACLSGCGLNSKTKQVDNGIVSSSSVKSFDEMASETVNSSKVYDVDKIDSSKSALDYFKKIYVREYNEENGTSYTEDEISLYSRNESYVWKVKYDDLDDYYYVTRGSAINALKDKLDEEGKEYTQEKLGKVYYTLLNEGDKQEVLECVIPLKENSIPVILGDDYLEGKRVDNVNYNVARDMGELIKATVDLCVNYNDTPGEMQKLKEKNLKEDFKEGIRQYYDNKFLRNQPKLDNER